MLLRCLQTRPGRSRQAFSIQASSALAFFLLLGTNPVCDAQSPAPKPVTAPTPSEPDRYAHAGLPAVDAARAMTVPPGFSVKVFAAEPDIRQPVAMAIDDRGRLWVAENYSYPVRVPEDQAHDRILIFEDTDGDGHFDRRKVFAEKLNMVSGLELGFGGVWVGAAPQFLFIPDADGDDRPDGPPRVVLDGWGLQDTHETLNTFSWGPDGWLYGCHGVFTHSRVGKPGTPDAQRTPINAGIWRYHPRQKRFEVFAHGTSNPWGFDFNDRGQAFLTACVIPHLYHVIQGGRYFRQAGQHFNPYTYDDIKTIAVHRHWVGGSPHSGNAMSDSAGGGHAHAGAMLYLGGAWPAEYRDQLFMNNIHGARINMDLLSQSGSGYIGNRGPDFLLSNDSWSQILNLQYGPDGQVYMIDWYDRNQCHHREQEVHDRSNGRIYKVVYGNPKPVHVDLKKLTTAQLVDLQLNANDWYVRHARRILQERGADAEAASRLKTILADNSADTRRLRALWSLHVIGAADDALLTKMLADPSPWVRGWAIQLLFENPDRQLSAELSDKLAQMARSDDSPVVRLYLASVCGRMSHAARWPILAGLLSHADDVKDHNLPLMYWYAIEPLAPDSPRRLLELASGGRIPLLVEYSVRRIGSLGSPEAIELLVESLGRADAGKRQLFLDGLDLSLRGRRQVPMPPSWPAVAKTLRASGDVRLQDTALALAATFGDAHAANELLALVTDRHAEKSRREKALAALLKVRVPQLEPLLLKLLDDEAMRAPALRALAAYGDPQAPAAILNFYSHLSSLEKQDALATLASRVGYARQLLAALERKAIPASDLSAELMRQMRNFKDAKLDEQIERSWGTLRETAADKAKLITHYKALAGNRSLPTPDPALGRAVFARTCQQCHTMFGTGGKVGPELTGSNRANLDYLLSNVVDPSAVIGRDYVAQIILMDDGRLLTGLVRGEDSDSLTLVTANDTIVVPKNEIEQRTTSKSSMMPDDILKPLTDEQVRALIAYMASPRQVPLPPGTAVSVKR
jgi:putative membrane-bound dehydrogenase-like protein